MIIDCVIIKIKINKYFKNCFIETKKALSNFLVIDVPNFLVVYLPQHFYVNHNAERNSYREPKEI